MRATPSFRSLTASLGAILLAAAVSGCATPPPASDPEALADFKQTNDPIEPANRVMYAVNNGIDAVLFRPLIAGYRAVVPDPLRERVHSVVTNLGSPVVLANDMMQAKPRRAGDTLMRFAINSTFGVAGIFDVATGWGYPEHSSDFGVTLALWGVDEGPFLFLPVLGPSNPRDLAGYGAGIALDPLTWMGKGSTVTDLGYARLGVTVLDAKSRVQPDIDKALASALDPYATYRSLYRQYRQSAIDSTRNDTRATPPAWRVATPAP